VWKFIKNAFTVNAWLKFVALILALMLWFYVVNELNKGTEEEKQFFNKVLPSGGMAAKKLSIKPVFVGSPKQGYIIDPRKAIVVPEYCIVVGSRELLSKIRFANTMPIDVKGSYKPFTKSVALNPLAPGVYSEETLVEVTVPVEKAAY
jgi:YbbR domain-containing protein